MSGIRIFKSIEQSEGKREIQTSKLTKMFFEQNPDFFSRILLIFERILKIQTKNLNIAWTNLGYLSKNFKNSVLIFWISVLESLF
jgi:hypothetical protein